MWTEAVVTNCDALTEVYIPMCTETKCFNYLHGAEHTSLRLHSIIITEGPLAFGTPSYTAVLKNGTGICPVPDEMKSLHRLTLYFLNVLLISPSLCEGY
jgi:hypothetical protein